jgi:hypothetical protein
MSQLVMKSRVKADGSITLTLPPEVAREGDEVRVTVDTPAKPMTQAEWAAWVQRMAGCITDPGFERHPQGEYEVREPLT